MGFTDAQTTAAKEVTTEAQAVEAIAKKIWADYKAGGLKNLAQDVPQVVAEVPKVIDVVKRDIPVLKAGKTTTEFVLVLVVIFGQIVLDAIGHPLPVAQGVAIDVLAGIYTIARSFVKTQTPVPPTTTP